MDDFQNILKQGESYKFTITRRMSLASTGDDFYILKGPGGRKFILKAADYEHYGLKTGREIICRADKINCTGQIFLEPEHPVYKIGEEYDFHLLKIEKARDAWGNDLFISWVEDIHKKHWPCAVNKEAAAKEGMQVLKCQIERIRKSQLSLSAVSFPIESDHLREGGYYDFLLTGEKEYQGEQYYILEGPKGRIHLILKDYYIHYGFQPGQKIRAQVVQQRNDLSYKIEPDNPYYKIGNVYPFRFIKLVPESNILGEKGGVIHLLDQLGRETQVKAHSWQINNREFKPETIQCKVIRFKKGKLQLENIDIMRVYTRSGDKGNTSLASGTRVPKYHPRLDAYGSVDELNSHLGMLGSLVTDQQALEMLFKIQNRVFTISSRLAVDEKAMADRLPEIIEQDIKEMEQDMDRMLDLMPPLKNFIIPGGHIAVAQCHIARTVCRRVERIIVKLADDIEIDTNIIVFINRLSDYLFVLARKTSQDLGVEEIKWTPDFREKGY